MNDPLYLLVLTLPLGLLVLIMGAYKLHDCAKEAKYHDRNINDKHYNT